MIKFFALLVGIAGLVHPARAAELNVLSAGAIEPGLKASAAAWQRESGNAVRITFATAPQLRLSSKWIIAGSTLSG